MRIDKIIVDNFQGIEHMVLCPNQMNMNLYGDNATGKTTIANAICWVLYNKSYDGGANFNPKPKEKDGSDQHNTEPTVTIQISADGIHDLKKTMREVWTKKRGHSEQVYSGNTFEYEVDGVPKSQKEFNSFIDMICPEKYQRVLTNPSYFSDTLDWQDRRQLLTDLVPDISFDEVLNKNPRLKELSSLTVIPGRVNERYSVEDYLDMQKQALKRVNKQLDQIPLYISEAQRAIPDKPNATQKETKEKIKELESKKKELAERLSVAKNPDANRAAVLAEIQMLQSRLSLERDKHETKENLVSREVDSRRRSFIQQIDEFDSKIRNAGSDEIRIKSEIERAKKRLEGLRSEFFAIRDDTPAVEAVCPTCGQVLPQDRIESAKEEFNLNRSRCLEKNQEEGSAQKKKLDDLDSELLEVHARLDEYEKSKDGIQFDLDEIKVPLSVPFENTEAYKNISAEIRDKRSNIEGTSNSKEIEDIQTQIDSCEYGIQELRKRMAVFDLIKKQKDRVKSLEQDQTAFGGEYERTEKAVALAEGYITARANLLTEKINSLFNTVSFKLFDTQINGGIKQTCEVLVKSQNGLVPYSTANNAGRINAGIEIIDAIGKHLGYEMPVILDNAESITKVEGTDNQLISLVVAADQPELKEEVY